MKTNTLERFINKKGENFVSICIDTEKTGDYEKNNIRWKNAISKAEKYLNKVNADLSILDSAKQKLDDTDFWAHQEYGLVGYFSEDTSEFIQTKTSPGNVVLHSDKFYVAPLLKERTAGTYSYLLTLSKEAIKMYFINADSINELDIHDKVVVDYDEAMNFDDPSSTLQHHSVGGGNANFHGQGAGNDMETTRTKQYLRRINDGLEEIFTDFEIPLILACVDEYVPLFKEVTKFSNINDEHISGNPDHLSQDELKEKVLEIIKKQNAELVENFLNEYTDKEHKQLANSDINDFLSSAEYENVDKLLVFANASQDIGTDQLEEFNNGLINAYNQGAKIYYTDIDKEGTTLMFTKRFVLELESSDSEE